MGVTFADVAEKREFVQRQRACPPDLCCRVRRGEVNLVTLIVAKPELSFSNLKAVDAFYETAPIGAAPEFTVSDDLQSRVLL